ncbi:MAG: anti-sigma factor antagonist [Planctomycetota bacterium]|nr:MAG: anti-sigma factor antagonist [Planctomycetota bacterium]
MEHDIELLGDVWHVRLRNEVRTGDTTELEEALKKLLDRGAEKIVIDLSRVDFLASSIIGVLFDTSSRLREKECPMLLLYQAARQIKDVIALLFSPPEKFFLYAESDAEVEKAFATRGN